MELTCPTCSFQSCGRYWDRCTSSTYGVKACAILVMLMCAFIAITGRGVVSILQAIVGVIFAIEGFWGAVRFDRPSIRRFLIYLVCEFAAGLTSSIMNLNTIDEYCGTANSDDRSKCETTAALYAYILLALSVGLIPILFFISTLFYLKLLSVHRSHYDRAGGGLMQSLQHGGGTVLITHDNAQHMPVNAHLLGDSDSEDDFDGGYIGTLVRYDKDDVKAANIEAVLALKRDEKCHRQRQQQQHGQSWIHDSHSANKHGDDEEKYASPRH